MPTIGHDHEAVTRRPRMKVKTDGLGALAHALKKQGDGLDALAHDLRTEGDGLNALDHARPLDDGFAKRARQPQVFLKSVAVIDLARDELARLIGYKVDSVSGFERTDTGWRLTITALELCRIPATTDVLASYEVFLNEAGDITSYRRDKRYLRNQVGEEE